MPTRSRVLCRQLRGLLLVGAFAERRLEPEVSELDARSRCGQSDWYNNGNARCQLIAPLQSASFMISLCVIDGCFGYVIDLSASTRMWTVNAEHCAPKQHSRC